MTDGRRADAGSKSGTWRQRGWMPVALLVLLAVLIVGYFLSSRLDVDWIIEHYGELSDRVANRPVEAFLIAVGFYTALVVFLLPGVPLLSIPVGLIMGWGLAIVATVTATALGISLLYVLTVWVLPDRFGQGRTGAIERLARGVRDDAVGYMLFLRLMPPVPFTLLNVALPALRVPFVQFLATSVVGMFPRLAAYCFAGEGLRSVIDARLASCIGQGPTCDPEFMLSDFVTTEIILATVFLALVSLAPIVIRRLTS